MPQADLVNGICTQSTFSKIKKI